MSRKEFIKKIILRSSVILLPAAIGVTAVFTTIFLLGVIRLPRFTLSVFSVLAGIVLWYTAVLIRNRARFFFGSVFTLLTGVFLLCIETGLLRLLPSQMWPFLMLFIGASFMVSGWLGYNRPHPIYIVPALGFTALGFIFLLFSTDLIRVSLLSVVLWWFPVLFLPAITAFILWLIKRHKDPVQ